MVKKDINKDDILLRLEDISTLLQTEIEKTMKSTDKNKSTRVLKKLNKRIDKLKKDIPRLKNKTKRTDYSNSGFVKKMSISKELADFLNIDEDMKLSRDEIQCALSVYIYLDPEEDKEKKLRWGFLNKSERDLRDPTNKRRILPDEKLSNLLDYENYKNNVAASEEKNKNGVIITDDSLYYHTLIKLIQKHIL